MSLQKDKGNGWEREVARELSNIFDLHFNRNISGSGSYVGGKNNFRKNVLSESHLLTSMGDIVPPDEMKKMVIECKFYKEFPFYHFLINKPIPLLNSWIEQQLDIIDKDSFWFIAFKINRAGSYIVIPKNICDFADNKMGNHSIYFYKEQQYIVTDLFSFLKLYKQEIMDKSK